MALKTCKDCGGPVSTKAKSCPKCGAPVKKETSAASGCLAVIIIIVAVTAVLNSDRKNASSPSEGGNTSGTPAAPAPSPTRVQTGDDARVGVPGQKEVFICVTTDAFARFTDLAIAKDYVGMAKMQGAGLVFSVPRGTKVKVIDAGFLKSEVRVMEGEHFAASGFVPVEWVTK